MIVVGQDFVKDGDPVEAVSAAEADRPRRNRRHEADRRFRDQPCPADARDSHVPARSPGIIAYIDASRRKPQPDVADPDHLRPAVGARHLAGRRRAAAAPADGDAAQDGRQRQGDALGRLRGRRLRAPRVRGRLQFRRRAPGRARQGRRRQARPAGRRRRAGRVRGQSQPLPGHRGDALRRPVRAHARHDRARGQRRRSSRCRACSRPTSRARATRSSRSSPSRCC